MLAALAARIISPWCGRYFVVVQGAMAPPARVFDVSGMMRLGSKSMVLPKPWQRGQAPWEVVHSNAAEKRRLVDVGGREADFSTPAAPPVEMTGFLVGASSGWGGEMTGFCGDA